MATKFWSLYSGGKDSTVTAQWLAEHEMLEGVLALDTKISTPDWLAFIVRTAYERNWRIHIESTSADYDKLVLKYGFPGASAHGMFMNYLKGRAVRSFKRKYPRAVLASGVRASESARRFKNTKEWGKFEGMDVWSPLWNWRTETVWDYFNSHGFIRSPAYSTLCISGDCLCGAYATAFERDSIRAFYPNVFDRISWLESKVDRCWGWNNNRKSRQRRKFSPVCTDCESPDSL